MSKNYKSILKNEFFGFPEEFFPSISANEFFGFPDEFFPSISAAIGDTFPARPFFQFVIALNAAPKLIILFMLAMSQSLVNTALYAMQIFLAAGWIFVSSSDNLFFHEMFMISFLLVTTLFQTYHVTTERKNRKLYTLFFIKAVFVASMIHFYIKHKSKVPGGYSIYSIFEWCLIPIEVLLECHILEQVLGSRDSVLEFQIRGPINLNLGHFDVALNTIKYFYFWIAFTSLPQAIWYFPLWKLGYSGIELFLLCYLSPLILVFEKLREYSKKYCTQFWGMGILLATILASSNVIRNVSPLSRVLFISMGCTLMIIAFFTELIHEPNCSLEDFVLSNILGLLLNVIIKLIHFSENPFAPFTYNNFIFTVFVPLVSIWLIMKLDGKRNAGTDSSKAKERSSIGLNPLAGVSFGIALFILTTFATDPGTLIRYSNYVASNINNE
ncbi:hypothetical protein O9G_000023 [Rozella allomycis CSF55]|uniref:Uncharacterized protein n=1 Tax=Rozella allomycis (strain CSF55) TaxID=988480 RepID=A0A075ANR3_ROZAC|nr:hypothetical protein O9G_000023 [Rozella allomycis CSF55]|eukprot:EPZ31547.1 hypothetical protein O9G_000023 [Rozella allomycis CSF55]